MAADTDETQVAHEVLLYTSATASAAASAIVASALVAKVGDALGGPTITIDPIEVTNRDSPSDYREFKPGRKDSGSITFDLVCEQDEIALMAGYDNAVRSWALQYPLGGSAVTKGTWHGNGMLTSLAMDHDAGSPINATAEIKCSGKWAFTKEA